MSISQEEAKTLAAALMQHLGGAIVATVAEFPNGAPEGALYLAFQAQGFSLDIYQTVVSALVATGKVKRRGSQLFPA